MRKRALFVSAAVLLTGATVVVAQDQGVQSIIGNVFLQDATPGAPQIGHAAIKGTFRAGQVFVQQASTATIPIVGNSSATGNVETVGGSFSQASRSGTALRGTATSALGTATGVLGIARGNQGIGVRGVSDNSDALSGAGVQGESNSEVAPGVRGLSFFGVGVRGESSTGTGVVAASTALAGPALLADNLGAGTGDQTGALIRTNKGAGVHGLAFSTTGITTGVLGETKSTVGFGVFSRGDIGATGTKSFVIDHPADPENRYLRHYCAEGPEPRNVYVGRVTTGRDGYATVRLPDYYAAVNRSPEYTLTVLDSGPDFVLAKVTGEVEGNTFQIRTSKPGTTVSWRVDAVRNDASVRRSGIDAEPQKPKELRGRYLAPDLYGQPESKAQWKGSTRPWQR